MTTCEICNYGPDHRGYSMIKCTECNISVHQECYFDSVEIAAFAESSEFVCFACQSKGKTIQCVDSHWSSDYKEIQCVERPMICELCSVDDRVTAMHPLFDYHGRSGRQICIKDDSCEQGYRPAWGHSLCCFFLSRDGFMYGVDTNGRFEGDDDDDDELKDTREPNPTTILSKDFQRILKQENTTVNACFRYYLEDNKKDMDLFRSEIANYKNRITCSFCGKGDKKKNNTLRIPQQCGAGSKGECDWDGSGKPLKKGSCVKGMHVGCARWSSGWSPNPDSLQHVFWFPLGHDDANIYCRKHALDVQQKIRLREAAEKTKKEPTPKKRIAAEALPPESGQKQKAKKRKTGPSSVAQKKQKAGPSPVAQKRDKEKSTLTETTATATSAIPRKKKKTSQIVDLGKTLASNPIPKKKKAPTSADGEGHEVAKVWASQPPVQRNEVNQNVRRGSHWQARSRKPKDRYMELDANEATAVNQGDRPTLSKSRREIAKKIWKEGKTTRNPRSQQYMVSCSLHKAPAIAQGTKLEQKRGISRSRRTAGRNSSWVRSFAWAMSLSLKFDLAV